MSTKQTVMGPRGPEKTPGFFSWRHATNAAHVAAREAYQAEHGREARQRKAAERVIAAPELAPTHRMGRRAVEGELDPVVYTPQGTRRPVVSR